MTLGKEGSVNYTSVTASMPSIFYQTLDKDFVEFHSVLGKEMSLSRRQVTVSEPVLSAHRVAPGKGSLFPHVQCTDTR
jgi:hypothetical protein